MKGLIAALALMAAAAEAQPKEWEIEVVETSAPLADLAPARDDAGRPGLALLTLGPEGDKGRPGNLTILRAGETPSPLAAELPAGLTSLAATTRGLLLGSPGRVYRVEPGGTLRRLAESRGLDLLSVAHGRRAAVDGPLVARAGRLARHEVTDDGLPAAVSVALPTTVTRALFGLRIETPPVTRLPPTTTAPAVALVGPYETGTRRLRSQVIDLATGGSYEAWALLPAEDRLLAGTYDRLGDRPVLLAVTLEQIGLLVEKQVRMFSLPPDRTRRGVPPILAFGTKCPLWGAITNQLLEADGDGLVDLVTIYQQGLTLGTLAVEIRNGRPSGGFESTALRSELDIEASDWRFAEDLTADGHPDLVVQTAEELLVYPGTPGSRRPVAARPSGRFATLPPSWRSGGDRERKLEIGTGGATIEERGPHLVPLDLDGDGRNELVALTPGKEKKTAVAVLRRRTP